MTSHLIQSLSNDAVLPGFAEEEFLQDVPYLEQDEPALVVVGAMPTQFAHHFQGWMDLYAPTVEPVGDNGYILGIGKYGSFGYEVEPKIGLNLLPQSAGTYRIETIPLPEQDDQQYQVDFRAAMNLVDAELASDAEVAKFGAQHLTKIDWQLDLKVTIQFPRFIHRLPQGMIQKTGDRLLAEIVKQVSNRLTTKVQLDFHQSHGIDLPKKFLKHRSA
jgi:hypothetical protein